MKNRIHEALNEVSDAHLTEAELYQKRRFPWWMGAMAAILAVVIAVSALPGSQTTPTQPDLYLPGTTQPLRPSQPALVPTDPWLPDFTKPNTPNLDPVGGLDLSVLQGLSALLAMPQYPQMAACPKMADYPDYQEYKTQYNVWKQSQNAQYNQPKGYADNLSDFFLESIRQFLKTDENSAYSPLNVYMALAMLAETTDGNSRQQVLDALGVDSIEALREQAGHVWNAHYSDDKVTTLLLGSSLWLDEAFSFHQDTIDRLASDYYASSFRGDLGTPAMDQQLQTWLNANTGGLLQEQTKQVEMDPNTVFALATTVYFAAGWTSEFWEQNNQEMVFHSAQGDLTTIFMRQTRIDYTYYWGDNFGAIRLELSGENAMWLILPDEGYTVADILASDDYLRLTMNPNDWKNKGQYKVYLSLPKFDVTSSTDLVAGLQAMGITDVFHPGTSDFTPLTNTPGLMLSGASHAARVVIDEEGCVAAAFTVMIAGATGKPPEYEDIHFTLDRPFLFVVSSRDNLPLFVGTVAQP